eukprot:1944396-Pleurochrysis_carterae.AAC.1
MCDKSDFLEGDNPSKGQTIGKGLKQTEIQAGWRLTSMYELIASMPARIGALQSSKSCAYCLNTRVRSSTSRVESSLMWAAALCSAFGAVGPPMQGVC